MSKANWKILHNKYPQYSNARNFVPGYTNRKHVDPTILKYIDFVAYEYITPDPMSFVNQFKELQKLGLKVVNYSIAETVTNKSLSLLLEDRRETSEYEVDGIIVADNSKGYKRAKTKYPKYAKAFKMILDDQTAEVFVLGINWEPSMHGLLNPVINVSEVVLDGAKISNASGYNAKFITNNNIGGLIGPGARIKLTRSGGVIPKVLKVIKPYTGSVVPNCLPANDSVNGYSYKWTDSGVDIVLTDPDSNEIVQRKRIEHFFGTLEVPFFKTGIINKVFENGYNTIVKILLMTKDDLLKMKGIKEKSADKIYTAIQKNYKLASLVDLMAASPCFSAGFGRRKIKPIVLAIPDILDKNINEPVIYQKVFDDIVNIKGYQTKTADKFLVGLPKFKQLYDTLPNVSAETVAEEVPINIVGNKFANQVFVCTGFRPKPKDKFKEHIISNGGSFESKIKSNVTHLIIKSKTSKQTTKIKDAIAKGVTLVYLDEMGF